MHDRPRHERSDNTTRIVKESANENRDKRAHKTESKHIAQRLLGRRPARQTCHRCCNDRSNKREARALNAEQTRTQRTESTRLNPRSDSRNEEGHAYKKSRFRCADLQRIAHHQWRRDDPDKNCQHVLTRSEQRLDQRRPIFDTVDEFRTSERGNFRWRNHAITRPSKRWAVASLLPYPLYVISRHIASVANGWFTPNCVTVAGVPPADQPCASSSPYSLNFSTSCFRINSPG